MYSKQKSNEEIEEKLVNSSSIIYNLSIEDATR